MTMKYILLLASLAGVALGSVGMQAIYAQDSSSTTAPAFYIADFELIDRDGIRPYSAGVESTFAPFGGKYIVRGGEVAALEGEPPKGRLVVIGFPNMERAKAWYGSPEYQKLKPIRQRSGNSRTFIVEGTAK
jgi:uncharacterized protein (DUF1330 family)